MLTKSFLTFTEPQFHNLSPVNLDTVTFEYAHGHIFPHGCLRNEKLYTALVMVTIFFAKHTTCQKHINNCNNDPILIAQAFDYLNPKSKSIVFVCRTIYCHHTLNSSNMHSSSLICVITLQPILCSDGQISCILCSGNMEQ